MDNQTISIIVPVYKAESTIKRCVDSILAQTYKNWELILVDDGSPDQSGMICDRYATSDLRIHSFHIPNGGAGNARNHGLAKSKSKWVTFIDSDDSIEPEYLANFHIPDHFDENDIIIMQGYRRVNPQKQELGEKMNLQRAAYNGYDFMNEAFSSDTLFEYGQTFGKLYNLEIIRTEQISFSTDFNLSEDHLFYLRYLCHTKKIITNNGLFYNYIWENNTVGLSRREHPYTELFRRYDALQEACNLLLSQYHFSSQNVNKINYFSVTSSLSLLLRSMYKQEASKTLRISLLNQLNLESIQNLFRPNSISGFSLKLILLNLPLSVGDSIMRIAFHPV